MPQVTIYMDEETAKRAKATASARGLSLSRWIAELIRDKTENEWPESVKSLGGAWKDFPTTEELRRDEGVDSAREPL